MILHKRNNTTKKAKNKERKDMKIEIYYKEEAWGESYNYDKIETEKLFSYFFTTEKLNGYFIF